MAVSMKMELLTAPMCAHCVAVKRELKKAVAKYPQIELNIREITDSDEDKKKVDDLRNMGVAGFPVLEINGAMFSSGWNPQFKNKLDKYLEKHLA